MGFLSSFSSEYRNFKRIPTISQDKNEIGELQNITSIPVTIRGILFAKKTSMRLDKLVEWQVNVRDSDHTFFFDKTQKLSKWELILDGDLRYIVKYVRKQYVFNAIRDHNVADLQLIE